MMQMTMTFGSTTVNLMSSGCRVLDGFAPATATEQDASVVERIELLFTGTTANALILERSINRLLGIARSQRNLRASKQFVYLNYAVDAVESLYRARVYDGQVQLGSGLTRNWKAGKLRMTLLLERAPYWEGALTAVLLTNGNGTDVTAPTGLPFFWIGDGTGTSPSVRDNWFKINDEDILGDLPSPAQIHFTPGGSTTFNKCVMGMYPDIMGLGKPPTVVELDNWTGGTKTADADASGGYYLSTAIGTTNAELAYTESMWDFSKYYGTYWRVLLRFVDTLPTDESWFQVKIKDGYTDDVVLGESPLTRIDTTGIASGSCMFDLGLIRLPPYTQFPSGTPLLRASLYGYAPSAGTVKLDSILLIPADYHAYLIGTPNYGIGSSSSLYHYIEEWGDNEQSYFDYNGTTYFIIMERLGNGIYLTPGYDNYLVVGKPSSVGPGPQDETYGGVLWMYYRPRRRNL